MRHSATAAEVLQTAPTSVLMAAALGHKDLNLLASAELAARGLDGLGIWVGFDEAERLHLARAYALEFGWAEVARWRELFEQINLDDPESFVELAPENEEYYAGQINNIRDSEDRPITWAQAAALARFVCGGPK